MFQLERSCSTTYNQTLRLPHIADRVWYKNSNIAAYRESAAKFAGKWLIEFDKMFAQ